MKYVLFLSLIFFSVSGVFAEDIKPRRIIMKDVLMICKEVKGEKKAEAQDKEMTVLNCKCWFGSKGEDEAGDDEYILKWDCR